MSKESGRKIKRSKALYGNRRKTKRRGIIAIVLTLILAAGLGFLGYSIAEPVMNFFKNIGQDSGTAPWTPPATSTETEASDTENTENNNPQNIKSFTAFVIPSEALNNADTLKAAVESAKNQGYTSAVVTLKEQGGKLSYKSDVSLSVKAEASRTDGMTVKEIAEIIKASGLHATARVSVLYDNIVPKIEKPCGYLFENDTSSWYDNKPANGGKPWLSPFSEPAKAYLNDISAEISGAGFDGIICSDVIFPTFRKNDLKYIGAIVQNPNRYQALINVVNIFKNNAAENGMDISVEIPYADILSGSAEVFKPAELVGVTVTVSCNPSELKNELTVGETVISLADKTVYDKIKLVYEQVGAKSDSAEIVPCIVKGTLSDAEMSETVKALTDLGYQKYIVK